MLESSSHYACYFTLGHNLPMKQGWWYGAISLAGNQCHCTETFQETIPTQRNDASTLDLLLTENTNTENTPLGVIHPFLSISIYPRVCMVLTLQYVLESTC